MAYSVANCSGVAASSTVMALMTADRDVPPGGLACTPDGRVVDDKELGRPFFETTPLAGPSAVRCSLCKAVRTAWRNATVGAGRRSTRLLLAKKRSAVAIAVTLFGGRARSAAEMAPAAGRLWPAAVPMPST